jgi:hypothetical protein
VRQEAKRFEFGSAVDFCFFCAGFHFVSPSDGKLHRRRYNEVNMKSAGIIFSGAGAMALMIAYHSIPFLIVRGGIDSLAQLRPFLLSASLAVAVAGFYQMWRAEQLGSPATDLSIAILLFSVTVVLGMILFPQVVANFLANAFAS